jgi:hypothetical protein
VGSVTGRQRVSLTLPPAGPAPIPTIARPAQAWRAHVRRTGSSAGAWWFSSTPDGRFDLEAPKGTCYLASDPTTALRERLGPTLAGVDSVEVADVDGVGVSRLAVPHGRDLADTVHPDAVKIPGLTREICTVVDYEVTRAWAAYFDGHHCGGVQYSARHTTALNSLSYAVFGLAGTRTTRPLETFDARDIAATAGLQVVSDAVPDADIELIDGRRTGP